jgi:FKBP-type peptidyl-prolyl cis-trans isomerase FklB
MSFSFQHSTFLAFALLFLSTAALVAAGTNEAGLTFLAENKNKPGVNSLPSGLQYKVLKKGRGADHPTASSPCSCHYEGKLLDGSVFDSSYERGDPTTFAPNQVIKGWTEAMQMMVVGDKVSEWWMAWSFRLRSAAQLEMFQIHPVVVLE